MLNTNRFIIVSAPVGLHREHMATAAKRSRAAAMRLSKKNAGSTRADAIPLCARAAARNLPRERLNYRREWKNVPGGRRLSVARRRWDVHGGGESGSLVRGPAPPLVDERRIFW